MRLIRTALAALLILGGLCGRHLPVNWKPDWKVGDWWVTKNRTTLSAAAIPRDTSPDAIWKAPPWRLLFEVTGIDTVGSVRCYAVRIRSLPVPAALSGAGQTYYFRCDNLRVVREMHVFARPPYTSRTDTTLRDYELRDSGPFSTPYTGLPAIPAFPLRLTGPEAESLKKPRLYARTGYVAQTVTRMRFKDFANALKTLDTVPAVPDGAYRVRVQQYWHISRDSILPTHAHEEAWAPGLPWALYAELTDKGARPEIPAAQFWLADYSGWHPKGARPDTVGR